MPTWSSSPHGRVWLMIILVLKCLWSRVRPKRSSVCSAIAVILLVKVDLVEVW